MFLQLTIVEAAVSVLGFFVLIGKQPDVQIQVQVHQHHNLFQARFNEHKVPEVILVYCK